MENSWCTSFLSVLTTKVNLMCTLILLAGTAKRKPKLDRFIVRSMTNPFTPEAAAPPQGPSMGVVMVNE
jgi:hypothetical protein